jgi:hypothetical protein
MPSLCRPRIHLIIEQLRRNCGRGPIVIKGLNNGPSEEKHSFDH